MWVRVPPLLPKTCGDSVIGNTSVSKTGILGSNPSPHAFLFLMFYIAILLGSERGTGVESLASGIAPTPPYSQTVCGRYSAVRKWLKRMLFQSIDCGFESRQHYWLWVGSHWRE
jgi:hypothetical protein